MTKDVRGIVRQVCGYNKIPEEDGEKLTAVEYTLREMDLAELQKIFNIDPETPLSGLKELLYCYEINEEQAKALQPYVIDGVIDLEKYDFMLECYSEN